MNFLYFVKIGTDITWASSPQVQAIVDHHHPSSEHSASKVRFKEEEPAADSDTEAEKVQRKGWLTVHEDY